MRQKKLILIKYILLFGFFLFMILEQNILAEETSAEVLDQVFQIVGKDERARFISDNAIIFDQRGQRDHALCFVYYLKANYGDHLDGFDKNFDKLIQGGKDLEDQNDKKWFSTASYEALLERNSSDD